MFENNSLSTNFFLSMSKTINYRYRIRLWLFHTGYATKPRLIWACIPGMTLDYPFLFMEPKLRDQGYSSQYLLSRKAICLFSHFCLYRYYMHNRDTIYLRFVLCKTYFSIYLYARLCNYNRLYVKFTLLIIVYGQNGLWKMQLFFVST